MRASTLTLFLLMTGAAVAAPVSAEDQACMSARSRAVALPVGDPSRRFAESDLATALTEMASGEVEECPELVERALHVIETRPYRLRPGEVMNGYGPDG